MSKTTFKILAIIFTIFSLGAISETNRVLSSPETDFASLGSSFSIVIISLTVFIIGLTIYFWKKSK